VSTTVSHLVAELRARLRVGRDPLGSSSAAPVTGRAELTHQSAGQVVMTIRMNALRRDAPIQWTRECIRKRRLPRRIFGQ
jgi:hypothetical protein